MTLDTVLPAEVLEVKRPYQPQIPNRYEGLLRLLDIARTDHPSERRFFFGQGHTYQLKINGLVTEEDIIKKPEDMVREPDEGQSEYAILRARDITARYRHGGQGERERVVWLLNQELAQPLSEISGFAYMKETLKRTNATQEVLDTFTSQVERVKRSMLPFLEGQLDAIRQINRTIKDDGIKDKIKEYRKLIQELRREQRTSVH